MSAMKRYLENVSIELGYEGEINEQVMDVVGTVGEHVDNADDVFDIIADIAATIAKATPTKEITDEVMAEAQRRLDVAPCPIEYAVRQWGGEGYDVGDAQEALTRLKKDRDALLAACKWYDAKLRGVCISVDCLGALTRNKMYVWHSRAIAQAEPQKATDAEFVESQGEVQVPNTIREMNADGAARAGIRDLRNESFADAADEPRTEAE